MLPLPHNILVFCLTSFDNLQLPFQLANQFVRPLKKMWCCQLCCSRKYLYLWCFGFDLAPTFWDFASHYCRCRMMMMMMMMMMVMTLTMVLIMVMMKVVLIIMMWMNRMMMMMMMAVVMVTMTTTMLMIKIFYTLSNMTMMTIMVLIV